MKNFPTEHGRWINSQRENRKHHLCNLEIGDELFLVKKNNGRYQNIHLEKSGATSGAGTAYPSGSPEFTPSF